MTTAAPSPGEPTATSLCVAAAAAGDTTGRDRLIERFSPVLLAQARFRMQHVRGAEPEDVVQETWVQALPKLRDVVPRDGHWTPVLLRFLTVILLRVVNDVMRRNLRRRGGDVGRGGDDSAIDPLRHTPADWTGIVTRLARADRADAVREALQSLPDDERAVMLLRGIEQLPNREVANLLQLDAARVTRLFQRALQQLKAALPDSVFAELE